ncbi:MAG: hypothetical protein MRY32_00270 [Rickettsiales bacterium]|nr:hypothetical protein [Rickettsiales bacterium]
MRYLLHTALLSTFMLSACDNQTEIQKVYEGQRDVCQSLAEGNIAQYIGGFSENEADKNAQLVTLFSDCMFTEGWAVATPAREGRDGPEVGVPNAIKPAPGSAAMQPAPTQQPLGAPYGQPYPGQAYPAQPLQAQPYPAQTPIAAQPYLGQPVPPSYYQVPQRPVIYERITPTTPPQMQNPVVYQKTLGGQPVYGVDTSRKAPMVNQQFMNQR